jgi:hypothetical protein
VSVRTQLNKIKRDIKERLKNVTDDRVYIQLNWQLVKVLEALASIEGDNFISSGKFPKLKGQDKRIQDLFHELINIETGNWEQDRIQRFLKGQEIMKVLSECMSNNTLGKVAEALGSGNMA